MTTIKPAAADAVRAAVAARTEELFRASGAFRDGHFLLKSGRHGEAYVEKFGVLSDPAATSELCGFWAARVRSLAATADRPLVELVAGPTTGGVILAFETARQLGLRSIFAEEVRDADGGTRREFRRGFTILPGERVLLVDDILTTGGSLLAMIPAVEALGGEIVECAVLVDRSGGRATLTSPMTGRTYSLRSLWQLDLPTYEPGAATCPRCASGEPLSAPGSTGAVTASTAGGSPVDRWTRTLFAALFVGVVVATAAAAILLSDTGPIDPDGPAGTIPVNGVVVRVDSAGLGDVQGFTLRQPGGELVEFSLRALENGTEFPPAHLPEHQATAEPVRVWYRVDGSELLAIRLEDAPT